MKYQAHFSLRRIFPPFSDGKVPGTAPVIYLEPIMWKQMT